jgi:hypothetical protein
VALNAVQDAQHFFGRLGIILSPEKPQAARAVLVHEAPEGLVARRNRGKHALIIRALALASDARIDLDGPVVVAGPSRFSWSCASRTDQR